ncbi:hypothetical protein, partial [Roseofilum sp. Belize Diploria]|uniref:hypothetical protein n=1 Tax=Roseofilum sp. Belize Diploria TaxID=2821501 RepID=UPI001B0337FD
MVEGEPCTDTAAKLGFIGLTVQAAEWDVEKLVPFLKAIAEMGYAGFVRNGDNDVTGGKHMDIIQQACHIVGLHSVKLDMKTLWTDCPEHGDITDWYDAGLASPEILEKAVEDAWRMHVEPPAEESKEEPDNDCTPQSERKQSDKKEEDKEEAFTPFILAVQVAEIKEPCWRYDNILKVWREWDG